MHVFQTDPFSCMSTALRKATNRTQRKRTAVVYRLVLVTTTVLGFNVT